jgi:Raf kinase inhibitor-like YbhB/YbcL family protein
MALEIRSTAFEDGEMIPSQYTCDGDDVSPPLTWLGVSEEAKSLALIFEDIDSVEGVWSHWVVFDVPPDVNMLPEAVSPSKTLSKGGAQGRNDFGNFGYGGPCPSDGKTHRYVIRLYTLDTELGLEPGATREEVLDCVEGHILQQSELMGRYRRLADR